jgi:hypothetical protein
MCLIRHRWTKWIEADPVEVRWTDKGVVYSVVCQTEARACEKCHRLQVRPKVTSLAESRWLIRARLSECARLLGPHRKHRATSRGNTKLHPWQA